MKAVDHFDHRTIDQKWRERWVKDKRYHVETSEQRKKAYVLDMFPYPSGEGLHVGHPLGYIGSDILARYFRAKGMSVLHPMGWDAFGLPAENYAIKSGVHPAKTTQKAISRYRSQLQMIGLSYDWQREVNTSDPAYYRWTQWLFLKLFEMGLAYRAKAPVNWCPSCQTVLANEQVKQRTENRKPRTEATVDVCERCETPIIQRELEQWFFKITAYADELLRGVDKLDWPDSIKLMQKNWIGKSEGALIRFPINLDAEGQGKRAILIHGSPHQANNTDLTKRHWFPWLEQQLRQRGYEVIVPRIPKAHEPNYEAWKETLELALTDRPLTSSDITIGHSAGGTFLVRYLSETKQCVGNLILVAAGRIPENDRSEHSQAMVELNQYEPRADIAERGLALYCLSDEPRFAQSARFFADKLQFELKEVPGKGHFVDKGGVTELPEVLEWLDQSTNIEVFTTRPDTLFGATYLVLSPEHPFVAEQIRNPKSEIRNIVEVKRYIEQAQRKKELERKTEAKAKSGVELKGIKVINPATKEEIPIWVADYVLIGYGTGAIMAVPAHDERDWAFAQAHQLPIRPVIQPELGSVNHESWDKAYIDHGKLYNSGSWNGWHSLSDLANILNWLEDQRIGQRRTTYRLRDWLISRQRYWGAPIPVIYCGKCPEKTENDGKTYTIYPVPEDQLPVLLPDDVDFRPTGESPLTRSKKFHEGVMCPRCGQPARREVDTMDTFVDSSWYFLRFASPQDKGRAFNLRAVEEWLPVDWYVGGAEHAVLHLLYARFITRALADAGLLPFREPFTRLRNQGTILGEDHRKMSKRWGNVVNPDDVVSEYGADALRCFEMFMGPFGDNAKPWSTQGIIGVRRWLERIWRLSARIKNQESRIKGEANRLLHQTIEKVTKDIENFSFNTSISQLMILTNTLEAEQTITDDVWQTFLQILAPFAPHLSHELWERAGWQGFPDDLPWPAADRRLLTLETVTLPVQINGRVRGQVMVAADADERTIIKKIEQNPRLADYLNGKKITKRIIIPGRIVNLVVS